MLLDGSAAETIMELLKTDETFRAVLQDITTDHTDRLTILKTGIDLIGDQDRDATLTGDLVKVRNLKTKILVNIIDILGLAHLKTIEHGDSINDHYASIIINESAELREGIPLLIKISGKKENDVIDEIGIIRRRNLLKTLSRKPPFSIYIDDLPALTGHEDSSKHADVGLTTARRAIDGRDSVRLVTATQKTVQNPRTSGNTAYIHMNQQPQTARTIYISFAKSIKMPQTE